jgi:hypothetical protein
MSRRTIIVSKGGSVFRTREEGEKKASSSGEQGDTEGLLRHLLTLDLQVVYFGHYRGEPLCDEKTGNTLCLVTPNTEGITEWSLETEQEVRFRDDEDHLEAVCESYPHAYINVCGYSPTFSMIGNPKGVTVQCCNVLYSAPMLNAIRHFKVPRILVNNDPRSYPKDQEMSLMYPEVIPAALLDQRDLDAKQVIGGQEFERRSVYAACESWLYLEDVAHEWKDRKTIECCTIAHCHIGDGTKRKGRDSSWQTILSPKEDVDYLYDRGFRIYGSGWEHFSQYDLELMPGKLRQDECVALARETICCPVTSCGDWFYTGKPFTLLKNGCLPILYGDGTDPYTWDFAGRYVGLDHRLRITKPGDLKRRVKTHVEFYDELLEYYRERFTPNFAKLDKCLNDLAEGRDCKTEEWFTEFGGYRKV